MTRPRTVANWRGQLARIQNYYEEGEKTFSKVKNVVIVVALGKYLGLSGWILYLAAPAIMVGVAVFGWLWVRHGWYAHNSEILVLEQWTPISRWQAWVTVLTAKALGINLGAIPTDRLPDEFTRIMASTQGKTAATSCPCCGGTAGLMKEGDRACSVCQRTPWHDACHHCLDHCRCGPHPIRLLYQQADRLAAIHRGEVPQTDGRD